MEQKSGKWQGGRGRGGDKHGGGRGGGGGGSEKLSRALSRLLRHSAIEDGVDITSDGWVRVADALAWASRSRGGHEFAEADVRALVAESDKQRFALCEDGGQLMIRANQGHSMQLSVGHTELTLATAPEVACHGTYLKSWPLIRAGGLSKMSRQHIHLARDMPGSSGVISGMRSSCEVVIWVDVRGAIAAGVRFFQSSNGVILTEGLRDGVLPPSFFREAIDRRTGRPLPLDTAAPTAAQPAAT